MEAERLRRESKKDHYKGRHLCECHRLKSCNALGKADEQYVCKNPRKCEPCPFDPANGIFICNYPGDIKRSHAAYFKAKAAAEKKEKAAEKKAQDPKTLLVGPRELLCLM